MSDMKNFSAANSAKIIPYNPLYRKIGKTVTGAILFQQMEYWFSKMGKPFYKFTEPSEKNSYYKIGQSWTEELGFSADEFRTAFDNIGIRYSSKAEYETAVIMNRETGGRLDVFAGKFYCSYHDKIKGITVYYRNHSKTDERLSVFTETNNTDLRNSATPSYAEQPPQATEQDKPKSEYKQENTSENTQKNKTVEKKQESAPSDKILGQGKDQETPSLPNPIPFKITIGNFIDTFIQRHSEFSPKKTKASRESDDRKIMPFDDLDCDMRMEELINLAKMYDEIIWRSSELSAWYKGRGFSNAMPVTISYLTRKKKDIEDAFGSLPEMDYMDRANREHNEYLSTLNAPKTSSQIIAEREAAGEVIDYEAII